MVAADVIAVSGDRVEEGRWPLGLARLSHGREPLAQGSQGGRKLLVGQLLDEPAQLIPLTVHSLSVPLKGLATAAAQRFDHAARGAVRGTNSGPDGGMGDGGDNRSDSGACSWRPWTPGGLAS